MHIAVASLGVVAVVVGLGLSAVMLGQSGGRADASSLWLGLTLAAVGAAMIVGAIFL